MTREQELDLILSQQKRKFTSSDRAVLELCDATVQYPWRTIRSKVSNARLYIEIDGKWRVPEYMLPTEAELAHAPRLTKEELFQMMDDMGI